jgi:hypothetical protein
MVTVTFTVPVTVYRHCIFISMTQEKPSPVIQALPLVTSPSAVRDHDRGTLAMALPGFEDAVT